MCSHDIIRSAYIMSTLTKNEINTLQKNIFIGDTLRFIATLISIKQQDILRRKQKYTYQKFAEYLQSIVDTLVYLHDHTVTISTRPIDYANISLFREYGSPYIRKNLRRSLPFVFRAILGKIVPISSKYKKHTTIMNSKGRNRAFKEALDNRDWKALKEIAESETWEQYASSEGQETDKLGILNADNFQHLLLFSIEQMKLNVEQMGKTDELVTEVKALMEEIKDRQ